MLISSFSAIFTKTISTLKRLLRVNLSDKFTDGFQGRRNSQFNKRMGIDCVRGFTLVEVVVTMAILIIFSGILVGYNQTSSRQLILVSYQAKLMSLISRAKSLSTSTFLDNLNSSYNPGDPITCAYGAHVDKTSGEIFIFRDMAVDCQSSDNKYSGNSERNNLTGDLNIFKLDFKTSEFMSETDLNDVIFIPPDPKVIINSDINIVQAQIGLKLKNSDASKVIIKVNNVGQISTR
jgi:prepilin-type N-terminal cleavage/methylation domain-containing protein